ncbi:UPF0716 protein FxsA [Rhodoblastus sphagnicola]|nr:FxsA family protein [Rhodoblastus sphagnicola]MBB4199976.1 UPF0716 protein FxsA [Rhodoblastus sphagnicola]
MKGFSALFRSVFGPVIMIWVVAELAAFYAVARVVGLGGALVAGVLTTLFGFSLLRENAAVALQRLRAVIDGTTPRDGAIAEGMIGAFGAMLLILPGFLSDLVGLVLTIPSVRDDLAMKMRRPARRGDPELTAIDLNPSEWRITDASSERRPRKQ